MMSARHLRKFGLKTARCVSTLCVIMGGLMFFATQAHAGPQSSSSNSAESAKIEGQVCDAKGSPIAGALVSVQDRTSGDIAEARTKIDGSFVIVIAHSGTFAVRAEKDALRSVSAKETTLSAHESAHVDLILLPTAVGTAMELKDEPNFAVAGVTDWSNVGLHGSDSNSRTSEALARDTLRLKPGAAETSGDTIPRKYQAALESSAKGDLAAAREHVQKALASGDDAAGHRLLGDFDEELGNPLEAVREYERAARMYPSEQNYFDWGTELLLHKAAQPAVEVFTEGAAHHPQSARMLAGLGAALYATGSYDDAARKICQASDLRPLEAAPYLFLGKMEQTAREPLPCGEEKLGRFAKEQPANALANYYYALALWKAQRAAQNAGGPQQAESLLEKATRLDPGLAEAWVQLGIMYVEREEFPQAIVAYKKAIDANRNLGEAHYRLSLAYKRTGDDAKAHEEFQTYKQVEESETAAVERQRKELRQFLVILKDQPAASSPR